MKKELSMRTLLINSISHETLMISTGHADEAKMRKHPDFLANMANFTVERWKNIFRSCNVADPKFPRYVG